MSGNEQSIQTYKEIMGSYPTGVTVITTNNQEGYPIGMTVNSFTSVSVDPLLISWSIRKDATEFDDFIKADQFIVNILDGDNTDIAYRFASKDKSNRFNETNWHYSKQQLPILEHVYAVMECKTVNQFEAGDHIIIIGEVQRMEKLTDTPMLYYKREMGHIPFDWAKAGKV